MATLKSFKQVIIETVDRKTLAEILDTIMIDTQKTYVVGKIATVLPSDRIDNQMAIKFSEPVKQEHDEKPDMHNPVGSAAQGKT